MPPTETDENFLPWGIYDSGKSVQFRTAMTPRMCAEMEQNALFSTLVNMESVK